MHHKYSGRIIHRSEGSERMSVNYASSDGRQLANVVSSYPSAGLSFAGGVSSVADLGEGGALLSEPLDPLLLTDLCL
jgi:hypothetical protein